ALPFPTTLPFIARCCKTCWPGWTRPITPSSDASKRGRNRAFLGSRATGLTTASPTQLHLQGVWQWRSGGQWLPDPVEDWADCGPVEQPDRGRDQDGHGLQRGRRLVRVLLLFGRAHAAAAPHWSGDRPRRRAEGVPGDGRRRASSAP